MSNNYLKNKRILITGINGFVGRALKNRLDALDVKTFGISRSDVYSKTVLKADILNYTVVNKFIKDSKIQICFHLASESLVEEDSFIPTKLSKLIQKGH